MSCAASPRRLKSLRVTDASWRGCGQARACAGIRNPQRMRSCSERSAKSQDGSRCSSASYPVAERASPAAFAAGHFGGLVKNADTSLNQIGAKRRPLSQTLTANLQSFASDSTMALTRHKLVVEDESPVALDITQELEAAGANVGIGAGQPKGSLSTRRSTKTSLPSWARSIHSYLARRRVGLGVARYRRYPSRKRS